MLVRQRWLQIPVLAMIIALAVGCTSTESSDSQADSAPTTDIASNGAAGVQATASATATEPTGSQPTEPDAAATLTSPSILSSSVQTQPADAVQAPQVDATSGITASVLGITCPRQHVMTGIDDEGNPWCVSIDDLAEMQVLAAGTVIISTDSSEVFGPNFDLETGEGSFYSTGTNTQDIQIVDNGRFYGVKTTEGEIEVQGFEKPSRRDCATQERWHPPTGINGLTFSRHFLYAESPEGLWFCAITSAGNLSRFRVLDYGAEVVPDDNSATGYDVKYGTATIEFTTWY